MSEDALLQSLLEAEHAAVYGYGALGARLDDLLRRSAQEADDAHRARRDELAGLLQARSADVPGPLAAYDVRLGGAADAVGLAVRLEEGLAVRWRDLVGGTDDADLRRLGTSGLVEVALRASRWRAAAGLRPSTVPLPGARAD